MTQPNAKIVGKTKRGCLQSFNVLLRPLLLLCQAQQSGRVKDWDPRELETLLQSACSLASAACRCCGTVSVGGLCIQHPIIDNRRSLPSVINMIAAMISEFQLLIRCTGCK